MTTRLSVAGRYSLATESLYGENQGAVVAWRGRRSNPATSINTDVRVQSPKSSLTAWATGCSR